MTTQHILLEQLRSLLQSAPPLEGRGPYGPEQFAWLGKASALISSWDKTEAISFGVAVNSMAGNLNRTYNHGVVFTTIHKAITSIEETIPRSEEQVFGPGATYDFFRALSEVVSSADKTLFLIDPYMDADVFDGYLSTLKPGINVRLLVSRYADNVRIAAQKFGAQHSCQLEARHSISIHDRVVFVDDSQCWVLGASIKDAAAKKPTYLAPLSAEVVPEKLRFYENIWASGTAI